MMTMKKINAKYRHISGLSQLQQEISRLEHRIDMKEIELAHDLNGVRGALNFENILYLAADRFPRVASIVESVLEGFTFVSNIVGAIRKKFW